MSVAADTRTEPATGHQTPAVRLAGVTLDYFTPERETLALSDISLDVAAGEFVAIVGPSGCGKSTLLSLISGLMVPAEGVVEVEGARVKGPSPRVGYMLQNDTLFEWRSVLDNALLGTEILGQGGAAAKTRAKDLLRRYGLGEFLDSPPAQLSGGMRQRVALARTLCPNPDILLLDEPFSALDFQTRLSLSDEIAELLKAEGKTVILVTHDIGEAISMADRIIVMSRRPGRIKTEHRIAWPSHEGGRPTPFETRSAPEFDAYFQTIWDELDVHRQH